MVHPEIALAVRHARLTAQETRARLEARIDATVAPYTPVEQIALKAALWNLLGSAEFLDEVARLRGNLQLITSYGADVPAD